MNTRSTHLLLFALGLSAQLSVSAVGRESVQGSGLPTNVPPIAEAEIKTMLRDYVESDRLGVGLVVGIVSDQGTQVVSYGKMDNGTEGDADGDTLFEIGSVTKVFTALLLQDMIERGEMRLDDPVRKYLPDSVRLPKYRGKEITLLHLATHTSGLPRDASGDFYPSLSRCRLARAPGMQQDYSNLGMALLGHVVALKAGKDYETLVVERICRPLGMNHTGVNPPPDQRVRLAVGHALPGHRVRGSGISLYPGAGALYSTANDLLKFVSAYAGLTASPLSALMRKAQVPHPVASGARLRLAWPGEGSVFEHGGLINGYQAELAFDVEKRRGVVVLSNCANYGTFVPGAWRALLEGCSPKPPGGIAPDVVLYDRYVGQYQMDQLPSTCSVRREGDRLLIQYLGEPGGRVHYPSFEVFPQSESIFCNAFRQVEATFHSATNGDPPGLTLTSLGPLSGFQDSVELTRISTHAPPAPLPIHLDSTVYGDLAGRYRQSFLFGLIRLGPILAISHERDELGDHLFASVRGYGNTEVFPDGEASFIPGPTVADDLRLTFVRNKKRAVTGVVADWNGRTVHGTRLPDAPAK